MIISDVRIATAPSGTVMSILIFFLMIQVSEELISRTTSDFPATSIFNFTFRSLTRNNPSSMGLFSFTDVSMVGVESKLAHI